MIWETILLITFKFGKGDKVDISQRINGNYSRKSFEYPYKKYTFGIIENL